MSRALIKLLYCIILFSGGCLATKQPVGHDFMPAENVLNTAVFSLDNLLMNTLASLELAAMTPEAGRGDWPGIKSYLANLKKRVKGVYFYLMPDGNYYSVEKDFTNLNLTSRGYFKPLFSGNQIKGFQIYSRSTGKKSAVMASPIFKAGRVTGALGTSVFLDDLHRVLNSEMDLPKDYTWFVVNSEGVIMLDKDADFIFMNVLTQGSESLKAAISTALKSDRGSMQYELGGVIRHALYQKLPNLDWWMILARIEGGKPTSPPRLELSLAQFVPELQSTLNRIDSTLYRGLANTESLDGESELRSLLKNIISREPSVITASYINAKGTLLYIEPREYKNIEGSDISMQEHINDMMRNHQPLLSNSFKAVEGFSAVVISRPVKSIDNNFNGSINLVLRPEFIVRPLLKNLSIPDDFELWIMQTDGQIIYDQDSTEIGRMLFSDPLYAEYETLLKLGKIIAAEKSGVGQYIFEAPDSTEKVIKTATWDTVKLHGREWRVVLCFRPYQK